MLVYKNETRLVGRPDVPVIITETGWCAHDDLHVSGIDQFDRSLVPGLDRSADFCTEEQRAEWTISAWQAWFNDTQLLASCPFLLQVCLVCSEFACSRSNLRASTLRVSRWTHACFMKVMCHVLYTREDSGGQKDSPGLLRMALQDCQCLTPQSNYGVVCSRPRVSRA